MGSLRRSAVVAGSIWALITITLGTLAVLSIFNGLAERRFNDLLAERHLQIVTALANSGGRPALLDQMLADPSYRRPLSGRYWQIRGPHGDLTTSRSLFDETFADVALPDPKLWVSDMASGPVRGLSQSIILEDGRTWVVTVAAALATLQAEQASVRANVLIAFGMVGLLVVVGAIMLTSAALKPLAKLREDVAARWAKGDGLSATDYPQEVAPLVQDINTLLDRNRETVARARRQAADMAHALKTPSSALRNELHILAQNGAPSAAALDALDRIDDQLNRALARIRSTHGATALGARVAMDDACNRIARLFQRMNRQSGKSLDVAVVQGLNAAMDPRDAEEVLGNLLENAFKWCRSEVKLSAQSFGEDICVIVEDDGPGVAEADRVTVMKEGERLDLKMPGTGLGLAIACDLLNAYGGDIALDRSKELGGLKVIVRFPSQPSAHVCKELDKENGAASWSKAT